MSSLITPVPTARTLHETSCDCKRCRAGKKAIVTRLQEIMLREDTQTGLYSSLGWTLTSGIIAKVIRYSDWFFSDDEGSEETRILDFMPYSGGDAPLASELLTLLTPEMLTDRQNYAPSLGSILNCVSANPGKALFDGYVIGPGRFDERISADAIYLAPEVLGMCADNTDVHTARTAFAALNLGQQAQSDELSREQHAAGIFWRFWWD